MCVTSQKKVCVLVDATAPWHARLLVGVLVGFFGCGICVCLWFESDGVSATAPVGADSGTLPLSGRGGFAFPGLALGNSRGLIHMVLPLV